MCVTHRLDESVCFPQLSPLERSQVSQPPSGLVEEGAGVIKARAGLPGGKLTLRVNLVLVEEIKLPAEAAEQLHDGPLQNARSAADAGSGRVHCSRNLSQTSAIANSVIVLALTFLNQENSARACGTGAHVTNTGTLLKK